MNQPLNPLVADYLKRKQQADLELAQSQQAADNQDLIGVGVKGIGAMMSGNEDPVVYQKGWNEQGTPVVAQNTGVVPDVKPLQDMANRGRERASEKHKGDLNSLDKEQALTDLSARRGREAREDGLNAVEDDPSSDASKLAQDMASKMVPGRDFSKLSATQLKQMLPTINKIYDTELRKQEMRTTQVNRSAEKQEAVAAKQAEKDELLMTPFGMARTADDTKKLKTAAEQKAKFDRIMQDMIDLRKKHDGGATWNREDVARGKQLSGDAKIIYKDLANLGVLSASDNVLIDSVIPSDPLEYNISGIVGQDPTRTKLESFKADADKDFQSTLQNRLREAPQQAPAPFPRQVRDASGNVATVNNEQELAEANQEGFK